MLELNSSSDRACALLLTAILDQAILSILSTQMRGATNEERKALFYGQNAILGSFSSKIKLSHAMGLLTKEQKDSLTIMREIRNAFAHASIPLTFTNDIIAVECVKLFDESKIIPEKLGMLSIPRGQFCARGLELIGMFFIQFGIITGLIPTLKSSP